MLDTNICIYLMKHQPPEVRSRFSACFVGEVVISAITLAELEFGISCSGASADRNRTVLQRLLQEIPVAPFEVSAAAAYGPVRAAARERNRDALDKLIAAHASALGVVLVTNNESDFAVYPGIKLENWVANKYAICQIPAPSACSSAWYELRTIGPQAAWRKPIASACCSNHLNRSGSM